MRLGLSFRRRSRMQTVLMAGVSLALASAVPARAAVIVSVQSVTASAGSAGNGIDVELTNSGPSALTIGGFSFGITVANLNISFTDANTSTTNPYVFGAHSLFGPDLSGPTSGQSLITSDVFDTPANGATLNVGGTVGLAHILFSVSARAAPGTFAVALAALPTTSLADAAGNDISIGTLSPGQITIAGEVATPEPSTMLTLPAGGIVLAAVLWRRRRNATGEA